MVLQAWGESSKQKKKHQEKKQASSAPQEDLPSSLEPEPEEPPVLTFPWEEDVFQWDWREILKPAEAEKEPTPVFTAENKGEDKEEMQETPARRPKDIGLSAATTPALEEDYFTQDYHRNFSAGEIGTKSKLENVAAFKSGFSLEPEDVLRGYIWYEILQPPRAKRPFFQRGESLTVLKLGE